MTLSYPQPSFARASQVMPATWNILWLMLPLSFAVRLVFAQWGDVPLHPDETYQYYEQAHRLVHGYGAVPWEYVFGIRSWFIPLCLAGLLVVADMLGLEQPHEYTFFLKSVLCLVSLTLPLGMYRLGQLVWNEQAAILSFLLGCFWHHFLYVAHKPMPGILAMYGLVWLVVWLLQPPTRRRAFAFGLLLGVVFMLRYQLAPVLGLLWLVALFRLREGTRAPMLAGNALALALAGILDWIFWGGFLSSFIDNFRLNFLYDIASTFGVNEPLFYAKRLMTETGGLFAIGLIGVALLWRQIWPVIGIMAIGLLFFHIPAHKELRFVLWILPFALIGVAVATVRLAAARRWLRACAPVVLGLWAGGTSVVFSAHYVGVVPWKPMMRDGASVIQALSQAKDVTAVDFLTPSLPWWTMPGYFSLGKPVPLYMWGWHSSVSEKERNARLAHVSHIITEPGMTAPAGYTQISHHGALTLWQSATPRPQVGLESFEMRTSYPVPIPRGYKTVGQRTPIMVEGW